MPERGTGRRGGGLLLSLTLVATGVAAVLVGWDQLHGDADPTAAPSLHGSATPSPETGTTAKPALAAPVPGRPTRLRIPALRVAARVLPVRAPGHTLVPPSNPAELGWWADGAKPGSGRGAVLVAGHTVHNGPGALNRLGTVTPGAMVSVRTGSGERLRYRVRNVHTFSKGAIAAKAARLFAQTGAERLVVVTCADWDGRRYLSNVVVTAVPAGGAAQE